MERRGLHMPDIALDAGNSERNRAVDTAERLCDGVAFYTITDHGAGRMGFNIIKLLWPTPGAGASGAHQLNLGVAGRRGNIASLCQALGAVGCPGRIDGGRLHHGIDAVSVSFRHLQGLEREDKRTFRTHVTIRFRVKGMALAIRADDPQRIEAATESG